MEKRLLNEVEACQYLNVSRSFLAQARMDGDRYSRTPGPPYIKAGKSVRYDVRDLDKWIAENRKG